MRVQKFQRDFFRKAGPNLGILREMADAIPGMLFNVVDSKNRIVAFNHANCENCNVKDESEIVGQRIEEAFPAVLANAYVSLYGEVRQSGKPIRNRVCAHGSDRSTNLRVANVFPLRNAAGEIVGTATFYQPLAEKNSTPEWYKAIRKAVAHIDRHFSEKISLSQLAALSGMSKTTFRRSFRRIMEITVGDYVTTIRINHARKLLVSTSKTVFDIALESGFYDQSHFIRMFKRQRHQTPAQYRKSHFSQR